MAFPTDPLDVRVDLQVSGAWTDITADVYLRDRISIARGRADEAARVDPGRCTLTLNNRDGKYSPRNPISPLSGLIGRNTRIRVSVPAPATYLYLPGAVGGRVSTPDVAALDITGDLDVRVDATLDVWADPSGTRSTDLLGKWASTGYSYRLIVSNTGCLALSWTPDNTTLLFAESSVVLPARRYGRLAVRATLDVDNGSSSRTITFWTAQTMAGPWTQLGSSVVQAGVTSIYSGTAALEVGDIASTGTTSFAPAAGRLHAVEVRSGIGGTVVANPTLSTQTVGATSFVDPAGRTWTLAGDTEITNRLFRITAEVPAWPTRWDVSGKDVWVTIEAAGILRRLGQGADPLDSTLRRRIPSDPNLIAYWPMEDQKDATQIASGLPGGAALAGTGLAFAADDTLSGSSALPQLGQAASLYGAVPAGTGGGWRVEMVYKLDTLPTGLETLFQIDTSGTGRSVYAIVGAGIVRIGAADGAGGVLGFADLAANNVTDGWGRLQITARQNGGNVDLSATWVVIGAPQSWYVTASYPGTVGNVRAIRNQWGPSFSSLRLGHIAAFDTPDSSIFDYADTGFVGDSAGARIDRLCTEETIPLVLPWGSAGTTVMGPQQSATVLDLLGDAADADMGILYEARTSLSLAYRPRTSLYNQATALALDYTVAGEVAPPLEPVDDDQHVRNDITVIRSGGSWTHVTDDTGRLSTQLPPNGVGRYKDSVTLNVQTDEQTAHIAGWRLHLGTADEARYPSVHVDLAAAPHLIDTAVTLDLGDRLTISKPPPWLPPDAIDLLVQGYTETLGLTDWDLVYTCTPASPWTVGVLDDGTLGRLDTAGSEVGASITSTATSMTVKTTAGPLWTTDPAQCPFGIVVGGERMTVTAVSGTTSPQTFTVTRSTNGIVKSQPAGTDVRLAQPLILAL